MRRRMLAAMMKNSTIGVPYVSFPHKNTYNFIVGLGVYIPSPSADVYKTVRLSFSFGEVPTGYDINLVTNNNLSNGSTIASVTSGDRFGLGYNVLSLELQLDTLYTIDVTTKKTVVGGVYTTPTKFETMAFWGRDGELRFEYNSGSGSMFARFHGVSVLSTDRETLEMDLTPALHDGIPSFYDRVRDRYIDLTLPGSEYGEAIFAGDGVR